MIRPLLFLVLAAVLTAYAYWVYLRAELPVRNRRILALLRSVALLIVLALLFDPRLPWGGATGGEGRWLLVDASLSMSAGAGEAAEEAAIRAAALEADGWTVVAFGAGIDGLAEPGETSAVRTVLAPALVRAAEAGVQEVRVVSDLKFADPVEVSSALAIAPFDVRFESVGEAVPNAGVARFHVADQARAGEPVVGEVEFFADNVGDSVVIEVREEERLVASAVAAVPGPGLLRRVPLELPSPRDEKRVRYSVTLRVDDDAFASDDQGVAYAMAGHQEGGLVVVSLRPDWEPRALLSVLTETTGLQGVGFLRVGPDRFVPMGPAVQRGSAVDSATVGASVAGAALLVVHGLSGDTDRWGRSLPRRAERLLVFPADARGAEEVGLSTGAPVSGEWYASPNVPASAIAGGLAGVRLNDLPPLGELLPASGVDPSGAPLLLQLRGTGPGEPALLLRTSGGRRVTVALASGFWRWGAREGGGQEAYRRLWSAVAGWLLAEDETVVARQARPERWVTPRGEGVQWSLPGNAGDSLRLVVSSDGGTVKDTVFEAGASADSGVLPPGSYGYRVEDGDEVIGEGRFDVEARTDEMRPTAHAPEARAGGEGVEALAAGGGRPLRTSPWPFLLVLALLCLEWVGRRRAGLR